VIVEKQLKLQHVESVVGCTCRHIGMINFCGWSSTVCKVITFKGSNVVGML